MADYAKANLDEIETRDVEDIEPGLKAVGYELRPSEMRPSVWVYDEGESNNPHYQREQEELYHVLSGRFEMTIGEESVELETGDVAVVEPAAIRQLTCQEAGEVFVVGAPNASDDGVVIDREE